MKSDLDQLAPAMDWQHLDVATLKSLVTSQVGIESLLALRDQDAETVMDILEEALDAPDLENRCRKTYASILRKLCIASDALPKSYRLTECVQTMGERPQAIGGFADVWIGSYSGFMVAVKVLKESEGNLKRVKKHFFKEALLWKRLSHPNVLPFLGVANTPRGSFCLVSSWMPNGTLTDYTTSHPEANRFEMLLEVAMGLEYLHGKDLVHGDLKGSNVLLNENYHAVLADFGLITIISTGQVATLSTTGVGTCRWMAPELFFPEMFGLNHSVPSKESDVYAFGMVIYEVMTGSIPFESCSQARVMKLIMDGTRPILPTNGVFGSPSDTIWLIAEDSWRQQPQERPTIHVVLEQVKKITQHWIPPSPVPKESNLEGDDKSHISVAFSETEMENERLPRSATSRDNELVSLSPKSHSVDQRCSDQIPPSNIPKSLKTTPPINSGVANPRKPDIWQVLDENVVSARASLEMCPPEHVGRAEPLHGLGNSLLSRYDKLGRAEDLEEAIVCERESLELCPLGHVNRAESLHGLGVCLQRRYDKLGRMDDIEEAVIYEREALEVYPPGHLHRAASLRGLGICLQRRYYKLGKIDDIEEAIAYQREALERRPPRQVDRAASLRILGIPLLTRYEKASGLQDIEEDIQFLRQLLELCPPGHKWHVETSDNLAAKLYTLFGRTYTKIRSTKANDLETIESAIRCGKKSRDSYAIADPRRLILRYQLNILRNMRKQSFSGNQTLAR